MVDKVKLLSLNVKGLRDAQKRRKVFGLVKDLKADIIMLQETHATQEVQQIWKNEWGGEMFFSNGDSNARGMLIMLKRNLNFKIVQMGVDQIGRILILEIEVEEFNMLLVNTYAPNEDKPSFFEDLIMRIESFDNKNVLWVGDFNLVMDPAKDRFNSTFNNRKSLAILNSYMEEVELVDIWRARNEKIDRYTWHSRNKKSRIDMFLINNGLVPSVDQAEIQACNISDHSIITLDLQITEQPHGPGLWKFNVSHLSDIQFLEQLNKAALTAVSNADQLNPMLKWEFVKMCIRDHIKHTSKEITVNKNKHQLELYKKLDELQRLMDADPDLINQERLNEYSSISKQIKDFQDKKCAGARLRCRATYYDQGERSSKYIFSLERSKAKAKRMYKIQP